MSTVAEIKGLDELRARMKDAPEKMQQAEMVTMDASMLTLWENVPPYPTISFNSSYRRTGTLGKTLGSSVGGGKTGGQPSIYEIRQLGSGVEGKFGTSLDYAPYVIGDTAQAAHMGYWWQLGDVAKAAKARIEDLWAKMADKIAAYIDGKGL